MKKLFSLLLCFALVLCLTETSSAFNVNSTYNTIPAFKTTQPNEAYVVSTNISYEDFTKGLVTFARGEREFHKYVKSVTRHNQKYNASQVFFNVWRDAQKIKEFSERSIALASISSINFVYNNVDKKVIQNRYIVVFFGYNGKIVDMAMTLDTKKAVSVYRNPFILGQFLQENLPDWKKFITKQ